MNRPSGVITKGAIIMGMEEDVLVINKMMDDLLASLNKKSDDMESQSNAASQRAIALMIAFSGLAFVLGLMICFVLTRNITTGIRKVVQLMEKIAGEGDLSATLSTPTEIA